MITSNLIRLNEDIADIRTSLLEGREDLTDDKVVSLHRKSVPAVVEDDEGIGFRKRRRRLNEWRSKRDDWEDEG